MLDQATRSDLERRYPGIVPPAFLTVPTYTRTLGPEVAAVCELASFGPDPEQQLMLDLTFGLDDRGRSAASEIVCICCRQNLKTGSIKQIELGWLFVTDERLVVHSAHEFNTSREAYRDLKELIEGSSILVKRIKRDQGHAGRYVDRDDHRRAARLQDADEGRRPRHCRAGRSSSTRRSRCSRRTWARCGR
jgi:hypothetical protein